MQNESEAKRKCLNCETEIAGKYCHNCGQKFRDHKESFGELVYEFFSDFTHWDSRFVKTILPLLFQPGKVSKAYIDGRKRSQFHPIRLYIFTSFVYFLLIFSCGTEKLNVKYSYDRPASPIQITMTESNDSSLNNSSKLITGDRDYNAFIPDSIPLKNRKPNNEIDSLIYSGTNMHEYLQWQDSLPEQARHGFWKRNFIANVLKLNPGNAGDRDELNKKVAAGFLHNIPRMMFFLLPLFALLLKLIYTRHRKFFYADHAVITLHYFSFIFIALMVLFIINKFIDSDWPEIIIVLWILIYLFVVMKKIFRQSPFRTAFKYSILLLLSLLLFIFAFVTNAVITTLLA